MTALKFQLTKKTTIEVELEFTKMLAARLIAIMDGTGDYLSDFDKEAITNFREAHVQDKSDVDLEGIALDHWESLNPGYVYKDL